MKSVRLEDPAVFSLVSGLWKGERPPFQTACVLRSTNFQGDGLLDFSDVVELEVETRHVAERKLIPGDIIIERSGGGPKQPVGRVALFTPPDARTYFTSNFTTALRIIDRSRFDPRFVALYLHALYANGETETLQRATTGIRNLDWREYLRIEVPELELDVQRLIITLLEGVRSAYLNEETQAKLFLEIKKAAMSRVFAKGLRGAPQKETELGMVPENWDVVTFESARQWLQYGTSTRCSSEPGPFPVLRIPNIETGRVNAGNLKYCAFSEAEAEPYLLKDGDLIFIRTNGVIERLGACAVYAGVPSRSLFASYLIRARLKHDIADPKFVAFFFGSELGTKVIAGRATPAADGKYNLNTGTIDSLPLPLPPSLDEQREIVVILEAIDRKIDLHGQKRSVLEELFKTLLYRLVSGELRDNDLAALVHEQERHEEVVA